ncbi:16302_t:CDS:2 [Gigaspora rosea]|nr:16302_t:CDS:2 [Gigaspora rosea]
MGSEEFDETNLCFTSSSVATNLFDEILNYNSQLQPDETKWQSFSDWNDVETGLQNMAVNEDSFSLVKVRERGWIVVNENSIAQGKKNAEIVIKMVTVNPIVQVVMHTDMK